MGNKREDFKKKGKKVNRDCRDYRFRGLLLFSWLSVEEKKIKRGQGGCRWVSCGGTDWTEQRLSSLAELT